MKEPVDKKVVNQIRQVFDVFEDPTAEAGWLELRKKYPDSKRRPVVLWLSTAAAIFLLAAGLWFTTGYEQTGLKKPYKKEKILAEKKENANTNIQGAENVAGLSGKLPVSKQSEQRTYVKSGKKKPASKKPPVLEGNTEINFANMPEKAISEDFITSESPEKLQKTQASAFQIASQDIAFIKIDPVKEQPNTSTLKPEEVFSSDKKEDKKDTKNKKLALTFVAGSYFNYSEGSENQLNFGAGFLSDIRINKNLLLSTGLSIAANSLNYTQNQRIPEAALANLDSKQNSATAASISNYSAKLLALDIPVNLKFQFVPQSDQVYLLAGLSSGTYLTETYAYQYRVFNTASGNYASQINGQQIKKQLNDFDLGRTLNLSLGLSTGFGKHQTISVEPFLKYPLGGLGSENLKFGSTGVNLKLQFKPTK